MKRISLFLALLITTISVFATATSAQSYTSSSRQSASSLERKIAKEIRKLPYYGIFDFIDFRVDGSTVVLDGKTNSLGTKRAAEHAVRDIKGVTRVVNNIDELPPSSLDDRIRLAALREFARGGLSRYLWENDPDVRIIVENSRITLEGHVSSKGDFDRFNVLANGITGVFKVTNNLIVGRDSRRA